MLQSTWKILRNGLLPCGKKTKKKLEEGCIGSKLWWNIIKDKQGDLRDSTIPPLMAQNGSKSEVKNYRPVSLLSSVSKVLEKIISSRISDHLKRNHLLCSRQFGFRKQRSAADLHLLMSSDWSRALDTGRHTAIIALDIEGAFDKVWHRGLLEKNQSTCSGKREARAFADDSTIFITYNPGEENATELHVNSVMKDIAAGC
ncbi:uncharacterized protein LOC122262709 [Penaeus japonicus]|uniref:uncharacterized protein LOC122262709 n=1 Tax=Penaeus japonicus TaxID=27405 RepID=UPI001C70C21D|nr:uncharacterized protein LOC122262709 [Penaeus japonicus]